MAATISVTNTISGQNTFSYKLPSEEKTIEVKGIKMNYYESGNGPVVLYLHGLPSSSYLWRNVVPITSPNSRSIAVDLAGYGKSDLPSDSDYGLENQYKYVEGFIEALNLKNITLVVNDLGSVFGLRYAVNHPENIKGIIYLEAAFMPSKAFVKQLPFMQKMTFAMMKNEKRAEKMIVTDNKIPSMVFKMGVKRKLTQQELDFYTAPYKTDIERRRVMLKGPGPAQATKEPFVKWLDVNAEGLKRMNVPMLLLYAKPGMITSKKAIAYAKENFKNIKALSIGKGKHFLPEDEPFNIGNAINNFLRNNP